MSFHRLLASLPAAPPMPTGLALALVLLGGAAAPAVISQAAPPDEVPEGLSAADWSGIRGAYQDHRHAARPAEGGYRARNPGQQWSTRFDGRGFLTEPDTGGWTWGLRLLRYGFAGSERVVSDPTRMIAEGPRVAYDWDDTLTEWYVNDSRGLEHGYTVRARPPHHAQEPENPDDRGPLQLNLAVRGDLAPVVADNRRDVRFVDSDNTTVLAYSGLSVFDADRNILPARFERSADGLLLTVDERDARYPLTIDPVAQQAYLKASNTDAGDLFGGSVAMSGNTVVVGALDEDSSATGVNGDQSDNSVAESGAAYVFVRSGTVWSQQAYFKASNPGAGDRFGRSVSISGDTVVIGAHREESNANGINGDQTDNSAFVAGAAYVFVRSGTSWSQQAYLKASNSDAIDGFGESVAVSGDTVVVGARGEDSNAIGVNGNQTSNSGISSGAAYVFFRSGTSWSQQAYLKASNTAGNDAFGFSVAVSGDTVVVGAFGEESNATGVNGDQTNNSAFFSGAAYVFVRSGSSWSQQAYLKASNTDVTDLFGHSVAVSGDTVVIGSPEEESNASGVNADQSDNSAIFAGAAYVFVRSGLSWSQQAYLKASNTDARDRFGESVAVSGDTVVVGARGENSNATGVNGDQSNNSLSSTGSAYVFVRSGSSWSQQTYLKASNSNIVDEFGFSVAVSGDTVVVGARKEDSNATGVNGDQSDNSAAEAGATYVFDVNPGPWTNLGCATSGTFGAPGLAGLGTLVPGSPGSLELDNVIGAAQALLLLSFAEGSTPGVGGLLKVSDPWDAQFLFVVPGAPGANSTLSFPWASFPSFASGFELFFQFVVEDAALSSGGVLSNGLRGVVP